MYDGRVVQFSSNQDLPPPPQRLLYEHFKQAILANMKRAGQPRDLDFDPTKDTQTMSVFETGFEKEWFEIKTTNKLIPYETNCAKLNGQKNSSKIIDCGIV